MAALSAVVLAAIPLVVFAADASLNTLSDAEKTEGWKLLFDGHSTEGWRGYARTNMPARGWMVEDGCLKNEDRGGHQGAGGGDLVSIDKFDDFDLKFEWKISPGGNSGVKYFVREGKTGKSGVGYEYQMLDDEKNSDSKNGANHQAGALYDLIAPNDSKRLEPVGQFNQSEIVVRGKHIEHWLNGAKIVEFDVDSPEMKDAIAKSKFRNIAGFGEKMRTLILLQDHGDAVWFRNLKIRKLNPEQ